MSRVSCENAEAAQKRAEYNVRLQLLEEWYEVLKGAMIRTKGIVFEQTGHCQKLEMFMLELRKKDLLNVFDENVLLRMQKRSLCPKWQCNSEKSSSLL